MVGLPDQIYWPVFTRAVPNNLPHGPSSMLINLAEGLNSIKKFILAPWFPLFSPLFSACSGFFRSRNSKLTINHQLRHGIRYLPQCMKYADYWEHWMWYVWELVVFQLLDLIFAQWSGRCWSLGRSVRRQQWDLQRVWGNAFGWRIRRSLHRNSPSSRPGSIMHRVHFMILYDNDTLYIHIILN